MKRKTEPPLRELLEEGASRLEEASIPRPTEESIRILAEVLNVPAVEVRAGFTGSISSAHKKKFGGYVKKRCQRMPLQYISGRAFFMGMEFFVNQDVLIPRNETEILAAEALGELGGKKQKKEVLELGCGSGCISVFLAVRSPCRVDAVDISSPALEVAEKNARSFGVQDRVNFIEGNLLKTKDFTGKKHYDIIVSNPPYVARGEYAHLAGEVKKEPPASLLGGKKGLKYINFILTEYRKFLKPQGKILVEIGYGQKKQVEKIAGPAAVFIKDYSGVDRVVKVGAGSP